MGPGKVLSEAAYKKTDWHYSTGHQADRALRGLYRGTISLCETRFCERLVATRAAAYDSRSRLNDETNTALCEINTVSA